MRLYTNLTERQVHDALARVQHAGLVTGDVDFTVPFATRASRTHPRSMQVQLGTLDQHSLPPGTRDQHGKVMRVRKYKNSGNRGAASEWARGEAVWAATWNEWGWFMAEVLAADPGARFGAATGPSWGYRGPEDFHAKTGGQFSELPSVPDRCRCTDRMAPECIANGRSCAPLMRLPLASGHQRPDEPVLAYREPPPGGYGDPDYVSPALRRAREQLKENEKLFTDRWDDTVFGPAY